MLKYFLNSIFNLGIRPKTPRSLHQRIRLTNQINFGLLFLSFVFTVNFMIKGDEQQVFGIIAIALAIVLVSLNAGGFHVSARILTSTLPVFVTTLTHAAKVPDGMSPIAGNYLLTASLMTLPYVVFDPRERIRIGITGLVNMLFFLLLPILSGLLRSDVVAYEEALKLENQYLYFAVTAFMLIGSLFILVQSNRKEIKTSREILQNLSSSKEEAEKARTELEESLKKLEQAKVDDENRNWVTEGISKFSELMRLKSEEDDFYDKLVAEIAHYMQLNQVAIFLLHNKENEDTFLQMEACYAYQRKKFIDKKIQIGEGLTGQVVRDRNKIYLTDVPAEYMNIRSGLGDSKPNCVLIMPMMINENIEGVIEMASFKVIPPYQIEFVERLSESIASIINSKRVNLRTRELLEKSQITTKELQRKEEEMRQNMEEMVATQESQKSKERELQSEIDALNQKIHLLEEKSFSSKNFKA